MIIRPYIETLADGRVIRCFYADTSADELLWHYDLEDRLIRVIESGGWYFQMDDDLPQYLNNNDEIFIKKGEWHRVLGGMGNLVVEISFPNGRFEF